MSEPYTDGIGRVWSSAEDLCTWCIGYSGRVTDCACHLWHLYPHSGGCQMVERKRMSDEEYAEAWRALAMDGRVAS